MGVWVRTIFIGMICSIGLWMLSALVLTSWSAWQTPLEWSNGLWFCLHLGIAFVTTWMISRYVAPFGAIVGMICSLIYLCWLSILHQIYGSSTQPFAWFMLSVVMLIGTIGVSIINKKRVRTKRNKYML
jgi:hypothetical protein